MTRTVSVMLVWLAVCCLS